MSTTRSAISSKKYCLITGSAGGLGLELAKVFAAEGHSLVLIDKDKDGLLNVESYFKKEFNISVITFDQDLSKAESAQIIYDNLRKINISPEVLVNNAGFGYFGFFAKNEWSKQQDLITLSTITTSHLTRLFLPQMIANKKGHILNIASLAAFMPGPLMSVYHASKAFLLSFSLALSNELKGTGVHVTVLCPGMMATGFQKSNNNAKPGMPWTLSSAPKVARYCYQQMMKKKVVVVPGFMNKMISILIRFLPGKLSILAVRKIQEKNRRDFKTK